MIPASKTPNMVVHSITFSMAPLSTTEVRDSCNVVCLAEKDSVTPFVASVPLGQFGFPGHRASGEGLGRLCCRAWGCGLCCQAKDGGELFKER